MLGILVNVILLIGFSMLFLQERADANEVGDLPECVPYDVEIGEMTDTSFAIGWNTYGKCSSYVQYFEYGSDVPVIDGANWSPADKHDASFDGLKSNSVYLIQIISNGKAFGINGESIVVHTKAF